MNILVFMPTTVLQTNGVSFVAALTAPETFVLVWHTPWSFIPYAILFKHTHITTLLHRHLVSFTSLEASVVENCSGITVILLYCALLALYSSDLVSYDVESDEVEVLCDGTSSQSESSLVIKLFALNIPATVPAVGYTLRATLDPIRNQIYLLTVVSLCV